MLELEIISTLIKSVESDSEMLNKVNLAATIMLSTVLGEQLLRVPSSYKPLLVQESAIRLTQGFSDGLTRYRMTPEEAARTCVVKEFEYCQTLFSRLIEREYL